MGSSPSLSIDVFFNKINRSGIAFSFFVIGRHICIGVSCLRAVCRALPCEVGVRRATSLEQLQLDGPRDGRGGVLAVLLR